MFLSSKKLERGWIVLEWETLHFYCSHLRGRERMCKFSLYGETKLPIKLKNFFIIGLWGLQEKWSY